MPTNVSSEISTPIMDVFRLLGQPVRLQIVLILARNEACVCHIEAVLGIRQATISQHLMVLRDAGMVLAHRNGRNMYYRLANPDLFDAICQVASAAGISSDDLAEFSGKSLPNCTCPYCNPGLDPELTCRKLKTA